MAYCIAYKKSQQWQGLSENLTSLTIRNRSSAIHIHLIEQTVDIQVRNGRVRTLKNVTQLRLINSSITVHIKSLQKNQAHVSPRALSIRQKKKIPVRNSGNLQWRIRMEQHFRQWRITSQGTSKISINWKISFPSDFPPRLSGIFGWMISISEISQFSEFPETSPGQFRTIYPRFPKLRRFLVEWKVSLPPYTNRETLFPLDQKFHFFSGNFY